MSIFNMTVEYPVMDFIDKMLPSDNHHQYLSKLLLELLKDTLCLDDESERQVVNNVLNLLQDKQEYIQCLAIDCLRLIIKKVKQQQIRSMIISLSKYFVSENRQVQHTNSFAIKTIISETVEISPSLAETISDRMTGILEEMDKKHDFDSTSIQLEAINILGDLLVKCKYLIGAAQENILKVLLPKLKFASLSISKQAINTLCHLVLICDYKVYTNLIQYLLKDFTTITASRIIQCLTAICKQSKHIFAEYIDKILAIMVKLMDTEDNKLRPVCFQGYEIFTSNCPLEISPYLETISTQCLEFIKDNLNCCKDPMENKYESKEDENNWKVSKAAIKCLQTIISTQHEIIIKSYPNIWTLLITQFETSNETVKPELFKIVSELLRQCKSNSTNPFTGDSDQKLFIQQLIPYLNHENTNIQLKSLELLEQFIQFKFGISSPYLLEILTRILSSVCDDYYVRMEILKVLNCLFENNSISDIQKQVQSLLPMTTCINGSNHENITNGVTMILPKWIKEAFTINDILFYNFGRFFVEKVNEDIIEHTIYFMAYTFGYFGDLLKSQFKLSVPIFLDHLKNESTQLATVKALIIITQSSKTDLEYILNKFIPILGLMLRKPKLDLKTNVLILLEKLTKQLSDTSKTPLLRGIVSELPPLLTETDLDQTQLTLQLATTIASIDSNVLPDIRTIVLPEIPKLLQSPLFQGSVLDTTVTFLKALVNQNQPDLTTYRDILNILISPITQRNSTKIIHRQTFYSLAKCVATVTLIFEHDIVPITQQLMNDIINKNKYTNLVFALLFIGEIGQKYDLSALKNLDLIVYDSFHNSLEEVKSAASYALGNLSIGNLPYYLPYIFKRIDKDSKQKYLLINALKEIICHEKFRVEFKNFFEKIWVILANNFDCSEDATRTKIAECVGKLFGMNPEDVALKINKVLISPTPLQRSTIITAFKTIITDSPKKFYDLSYMKIFTEFLKDPDYTVRRSCLQLFNIIAKNHPKLIHESWTEIYPFLYTGTKINPELIHQIKIGPFKHRIDCGLNLRKIAFECMLTLLESCSSWINIYEFFDYLEHGLSDHDDIKIICYLIVCRMTQKYPTVILKCMQRLVVLLRQTLHDPSSSNLVKKSYNIDNNDLRESAMKVVVAFVSIPCAEKYPVLKILMHEIKSSHSLQTLFESVSSNRDLKHKIELN